MTSGRHVESVAGTAYDMATLNKVKGAIVTYAQAGLPLDEKEIASWYNIAGKAVHDIIERYHLKDEHESITKIYKVYHARRRMAATRSERKFKGDTEDVIRRLSCDTGLSEQDVAVCIKRFPLYTDCMREYPVYSAKKIKNFLETFSESPHDARPSMRTVIDAYRDGERIIQSARLLFDSGVFDDKTNSEDFAQNTRGCAGAKGMTFDEACGVIAKEAGVSPYDVPQAPRMIEWAQTVMYYKMAGFVGGRASQYAKSVAGTTYCDYEDLFQEGMAAVVEYMSKYNPELTTPTTFFNFSLQHALTDSAQTALNNINSSHYGARVTAVKKAVGELERDGLPPSTDAISRKTGMSYQQVADTLAMINRTKTTYIDEQPNVDGFLDSQASNAMLTTSSSTNPLKSVIADEQISVLGKAVREINHDAYTMFLLAAGLENMEKREKDGSPVKKRKRPSEKTVSFTMISQLCRDACAINERARRMYEQGQEDIVDKIADEMGVRCEYVGQCLRIFENPQKLGVYTTHSVEMAVAKVKSTLARNPAIREMYDGKDIRNKDSDEKRIYDSYKGSALFVKDVDGMNNIIQAFDEAFLDDDDVYGDIVDDDGNILDNEPHRQNSTIITLTIS